MSCRAATALGTPEPTEDTSEWIQALAADPDGESAPGYRNAELFALHRRPATPPGVIYRERVVYGHADGVDLTLRLYARACPGEQRPAVLFLHGGGWVAGDPSMHMRHAHGLAERGFVTVLVTYRRPPVARWPGALHDAKCAMRWLRSHAGEVGADPGRIAVAGSSAGGQLAALVGLTPGLEEGTGGHTGVSSAAQAMVLWYPAVDLALLTLPDEQRAVVESYFGGRLAELPPEVSPLRMVGTATPPPTLLLTGAADATTSLQSVEQFAAAVAGAGGLVQLVAYAGREHAFNLLPGDWEESFLAAAAFLESVFAPHTQGAAP